MCLTPLPGKATKYPLCLQETAVGYKRKMALSSAGVHSATRLATAEIRAWDIRNKMQIPLINIRSLI